MIGSIIGGALGVGGAIFGGLSASAALRKVKKSIEEDRRRNKDWFDRRYNEDATQRADAQQVLNQTQEILKRNTAAAEGKAAVMGATDESVAAAKAAANQTVAQTMSNINAAGAARKDAIEASYRNKDAAYAEQLNNVERDKAQAITNAVSGVVNAGAKIASAF